MSSVHGFSLRTGLSAEQQRLCLPKLSSGRKKDRITMLHALPSQALTSIWMSLILKLFASDIIFANHNPLIVPGARRRERSTNGRSNRCDPRQSCTANSAACGATDPEGLAAQGELISLSRDRARPPLEYAAQTDHSSPGGLQIPPPHDGRGTNHASIVDR